MTRAFIAIDVATGTAGEVCHRLRDADGVVEAHVITGDFDVLVELTGDDQRDLLETMTTVVRPLEDIGAMRTYVCLD
ncbi:Lrp/AsnC ligand binding domain-containing protein [Natrinema pallidum]|uniref:AsnC family transcriptional regulator n=2 Tax=Natrinema pallidum TaxID=69527 RepID=L9YWM9_9EURY|nr:Lrp/AsnC ligand binding domain-containing protein [Natrinema pallidum]ELY78620.1 AsnC family transcriptional regulator [Natrinema pallidum DSM 3751]QCW01975.1 Lrp/AsnC family transcriptional regulator [Natrinema pallidum]